MIAILLKNIRKLCAEHHITIKELERETGLGNGVIARWDRHSPRLDAVVRIAGFFHKTVDELIGGNAE